MKMNWMTKWAGSYPIFVDHAKGAHFTDVDGNEYLDLCLGDTGSMTGHAPDAAVAAITEYVKKGTTFMLPTEDAIWNSEELSVQHSVGVPIPAVSQRSEDGSHVPAAVR